MDINPHGMFDDSEWTMLEELRELLWETFPVTEDVTDWLQMPSPFLQGMTPIDAIQEGQIAMVRDALVDLTADL